MVVCPNGLRQNIICGGQVAETSVHHGRNIMPEQSSSHHGGLETEEQKQEGT